LCFYRIFPGVFQALDLYFRRLFVQIPNSQADACSLTLFTHAFNASNIFDTDLFVFPFGAFSCFFAHLI
jgi:hypothetical protein